MWMIRQLADRMSQQRDKWRDPALSFLLVMQCFTIYCVVPAAATSSRLPSSVVGVLPLIFASCVIFATHKGSPLMIGLAALLLSAIIAVLERFNSLKDFLVAEDALAIATFMLLTIAVFRAVFAPGRFTGHRVLGSIALYLNIGLLFGLVFRLINTVSPGAFANLPPNSDQSALRAALEYFSFSILTSVGFGDIIPVSPIARSLSVLEASVGHLYPATLLARAVTKIMRVRGD
ncbi:potassium channel family protein [Dyella psychrodurans]|uniref:Two pore domain potassium channel family protein n=1 Tax=Dyella psychrodurans TaxID=1927960 RepID=A0A370XE28_9GAMM|nr:potassium channel family protein [Dyella psychrodurans]RDS86684.1 two pore domain potassium channel family protein [Dyella psychrodurans]